MGGKRRSVQVSSYLPEDTAKDLEEWAKEEKRSVSNLAASILTDAVNSKKQSTEEKK